MPISMSQSRHHEQLDLPYRANVIRNAIMTALVGLAMAAIQLLKIHEGTWQEKTPFWDGNW